VRDSREQRPREWHSLARACASRPFVEELTAAIKELESNKKVYVSVSRPTPVLTRNLPVLAR